ncbi:MAG: bifunctional nuclease family protein [Verrucomicrobia bacterium]|nr:bifunctional nuclease family protein [Verrucomicrobiota bacterium]
MQSEVIPVAVKGIMPTSNGCALFLGATGKTIIMYIDNNIGTSIAMISKKTRRERPLTHDLMANICSGFGIQLERVVIHEVRDKTFFSRIILRMHNELGTKILEVDARPSDAIALALLEERPILLSRSVLDHEEDVSELLERILKEQGEQ